jgi:hypothetical protein
MADGVQFVIAKEEPPERYTATITLSTEVFADLGPVLDAVENVVRIAPNVTGKVEAEQYSRTFYGWDWVAEEV